MGSDIKEPDNRPREKIEKLISGSQEGQEQRIFKRLAVEPGTQVIFPVVCKGEIMDISDDGLSIRFKPSDSPSLADGSVLPVTVEMEKHTFRIPAEIRRFESRFGVIVLGMQYRPDEIEVL